MKVAEIFKRQVTVAHIFGIPVRFDYRWFIVFVLSVWLIAMNLSRSGMWVGSFKLMPVSVTLAWLLAIVTTIGLFLSVLGHELSHALMGRAEGIEIEEIVLHPFGGLARLRNEPDSPRAEFRIAIAGPAASFLFAAISFVLMLPAVRSGFVTAGGVLLLLCAGNLLLAVFNLFPGYPLDGGRILRALLWRRSGSIKEATRMAGICGILIGGTLIIFGVYMAIAPTWRPSQPYFMGGWSILVGLFLLDTAAKVVKGAQNTRLLTAGDVMSPPVTIDPAMTVTKLIDDVLPLHRQTSFPVAVQGRAHGILALEDLKPLPKEKWHTTQVKDVMRTINAQLFVDTSTTFESAKEIMKDNGTGS